METKELNLFVNYSKTEDNVTHGFISLLHCVGERIAKSIIESLCPNIKMNYKIIYDIQSPSIDNDKIFRNASNGFILGISSIGTEIIKDISDKKESRADGWIYDGKNLILIESKVVDKFSEDQLSRHKQQLEKYCSTVKGIESITWQKIDGELRFLLNKNDIN